jgi:hypothetical protein
LEVFMAGRSRASSQKRQKEQLRMERRQEKAARKMGRKLEKTAPEGSNPEDAEGVLVQEQSVTTSEPQP